jgi:hypothetical protein
MGMVSPCETRDPLDPKLLLDPRAIAPGDRRLFARLIHT